MMLTDTLKTKFTSHCKFYVQRLWAKLTTLDKIFTQLKGVNQLINEVLQSREDGSAIESGTEIYPNCNKYGREKSNLGNMWLFRQ